MTLLFKVIIHIWYWNLIAFLYFLKVYLAMEAGYSEKVDELCDRYSLEGFLNANGTTNVNPSCHSTCTYSYKMIYLELIQ